MIWEQKLSAGNVLVSHAFTLPSFAIMLLVIGISHLEDLDKRKTIKGCSGERPKDETFTTHQCLTMAKVELIPKPSSAQTKELFSIKCAPGYDVNGPGNQIDCVVSRLFCLNFNKPKCDTPGII